MDFDTDILFIAGAIVLALLVLLLVLARGRKQRVALSADQRPQVAARARHIDLAEGRAVTDEAAAAARDVAGEILGVEAHPVAPPATGPADNLQTLKGVGPKLAAQLNANGITQFGQLARLTPNEVAILDEKMGAFRGRIARDRLAEQAAYLAQGDTEGFEAKFGRIGGA